MSLDSSSQSLPTSLRKKQNINSEQSSLPKSLKSKQQDGQENKFLEDENDIEREIERNQAMVTSRMIERLFGSFGNAYQMTPEILKKAQPLNFLFNKIPTEKDIRKFSEKTSGGYLEPKTPLEEKGGEFAGDVASYAMGNPGKSLLGSLSRTIGIPLAGQMVKEGVGKLGGSEKTKEYTKLGSQVLLDLWGINKGNGGGAKAFGQRSLDEAEKAIPKTAIADVKVFQKSLQKTKNELRSGVTGEHTSEALRVIDEIEGHIKDGHMDAWRFPKIRKDINKIIENLKGFSLTGPPRNIKRAAVENINTVKKSLIQAGNRWGRGNSPEFFKKWREGNEALSVYYKSNDLANFFSKATKIKNPVLKVMLGVHGYHNPVKYAGLQVARKGIELATKFPTAKVYRFTKSKVLRKLYSDVMKEGAKGNSGAAASAISKLEKEMEKENIK